jgi:hypothetical protein
MQWSFTSKGCGYRATQYQSLALTLPTAKLSPNALRPQVEHPEGIAILCTVLGAPVIILLGIVATTNLKFLIGGHL